MSRPSCDMHDGTGGCLCGTPQPDCLWYYEGNEPQMNENPIGPHRSRDGYLTARSAYEGWKPDETEFSSWLLIGVAVLLIVAVVVGGKL